MKIVIALFLLFISSLASAKYYCINYKGIGFSISIPDGKDIENVFFVNGLQLHFQETVILFSNNSGFSNNGIDVALSILAYLLENSIEILENLVSLNVLDSNDISFLHRNYPYFRTNNYGVATLISSGQCLSFVPLENLIDGNNEDDHLSDEIEAEPLTYGAGVIANYPCLYGCSNEVFPNTWKRSKHHNQEHSEPRAEIDLLLKKGLCCPMCNKEIITYNQLAQHLRFHKFRNYFKFLGKYLQH